MKAEGSSKLAKGPDKAQSLPTDNGKSHKKKSGFSPNMEMSQIQSEYVIAPCGVKTCSDLGEKAMPMAVDEC
ncbi:unnamed protein product [Linum trigynum]|uniref:Uncharacterized protein n=1 Tax=Linum trigynum TaxID=586398 RepID=A0AAV2GS79_9ROSI